MSVNNFIPEMWSPLILEPLDKALVFADCCNRDYEGDIAQAGDSVHINSVGPVTIATYTKNSTTVTPEVLNDSDMTLQITESKYFAFVVDDVDKRQAQGNILSGGMKRAAYGIANTIDQFIATKWADAGSIITTVAITSLNAYESMLTMKQTLDEANAPVEGRWAILPPWFITKLLLAEAILENTTNDAWNGRVARCAGFDLRVSNNVATSSTTYYPMAGTTEAITFAHQLASIEAYRPEGKFGDAVKGLDLYGAKVVQPNALVVQTCTEGTEA
jgi:hypothetical protein